MSQTPTSSRVARVSPPAETDLFVELREANERLILATLRSQELLEEAKRAQSTAERATQRIGDVLDTSDALRREMERTEAELRSAGLYREELLGIVGHDLRNPLAAIKMASTMLARDLEISVEQRHVAGLIGRSADRMSRMIGQLFSFTRLRVGDGLTLDKAPSDLREIMERVIDELDMASGTKIERSFEGELTGMWDAGLLAEMFSNVGGNALSHATRGTQVSIKGWQDGDWAIVEISNHGEPIPSGLMPHLFDPFRRGRQTKEASSHRVRSGNLGLGLHIAHQVATAHGGGISAGCEGGITTFSVRLPWSQIEKGSARDASFNTSWGR